MINETVLQRKGSYSTTHNKMIHRYYLYYESECIAQINSGKTPEEVYGGIEGWMSFVAKRTEKRMKKIDSMVIELGAERDHLNEIYFKLQLDRLNITDFKIKQV